MAISKPWRNIIGDVPRTAPAPNVEPLHTPEEIAARIREIDGLLIQLQADAERALIERKRLQTALLEFTKQHMQGWRIEAEYIAEADGDPV